MGFYDTLGVADPKEPTNQYVSPIEKILLIGVRLQ